MNRSFFLILIENKNCIGTRGISGTPEAPYINMSLPDYRSRGVLVRIL
jgi:hypothetical protein